MISSLSGSAANLGLLASRYGRTAASGTDMSGAFSVSTSAAAAGTNGVSISAEALRLHAAAEGQSSGSPDASTASNDDTAAKLKEALDDFKKEASMTPAQRARRDVLKSMNLSEDDLKAMPDDRRQAIEKSISDEVARRLQLTGTHSGQHASMTGGEQGSTLG